jgi:hypothetical protein
LLTPRQQTQGTSVPFLSQKIDDSISTRQKKQQDMGRYEGMIYSKKEAKMDKLTWLVLIFDNVKGGKDCKGLALLCHLDKKVMETNYL